MIKHASQYLLYTINTSFKLKESIQARDNSIRSLETQSSHMTVSCLNIHEKKLYLYVKMLDNMNIRTLDKQLMIVYSKNLDIYNKEYSKKQSVMRVF